MQSIAADFSNLKMLGHVYVVEDAKDLAQIVRDVTRYGGAYRPEVLHSFTETHLDITLIDKPNLLRIYMNSFNGELIGRR